MDLVLGQHLLPGTVRHEGQEPAELPRGQVPLLVLENSDYTVLFTPAIKRGGQEERHRHLSRDFQHQERDQVPQEVSLATPQKWRQLLRLRLRPGPLGPLQKIVSPQLRLCGDSGPSLLQLVL